MASVKQALQWALEEINESDSGQLDAELLLGEIIGKSRAWIYTWPESALGEHEHQLFQQLVMRRKSGEPVAHLIGKQEFWSLELKVTGDTLIPRPETETLVEQALKLIPTDKSWRVADLGTGTGAIAIAIASERPDCTIIATDQSRAALSVAEENSSNHQLNNIEYRDGSWFLPLEKEKFNIILSNPPYIAMEDPHLEQGDLRYEPNSALASGKEGMDDIRYLINHAANFLHKDGILMIEHGYDQGEKARELLQQQSFSSVTTTHDISGHERVSYGFLT